MKKPAHITEVFLQPGDFYFGGKDTRIRTLLGSCVSITLWHPTRLIGGMCHYLLPRREQRRTQTLDGRYAEDAIRLLLREIRGAKSHPSEYQLKIFGAGNMFSGQSRPDTCGRLHGSWDEMRACGNISCKNISIARSLAALHGFEIEAEDLGGAGHRQVIFDIGSGHVWVRHVKAPAQAA